MANHDIRNDATPVNKQAMPAFPTVAGLRSALTTYDSTSYSDDRLNAMGKNDMIYAARLHGVTVPGL